jgi:LPS sulfotransferase NodH
MENHFDYFVVLAGMRTGSNFLEANLNSLEGLACHGEAFNPHFIGYPNKSEVLGITREARDEDPARLIGAIRDEPGALRGFRFFHDHDHRALELALDDARCAKIILTRNPLDSYVSWKIAKATGQWKLTDVKRRKEARAVFDGQEFQSYLKALQDFQVMLLSRLQTGGQVPFYLAYEDLQSVDVMNGLAAWLGARGRLKALDKSLKPQNPKSVAAKVANPGEMEKALAGLDHFNLSRTPNFEPRRGAAVPSYVAGVKTGLLYLPIRGGPEAEVIDWLAGLDGVGAHELATKMNQKQLRVWKRKHPGHRSFTVLRHPAARAHSVFCRRILNTGEGSYQQIRETLRKQFKLPIPGRESKKPWSVTAHRRAFEAYLEFVRMNLAGQTAIRVDAAWGTQAQALASFGDFVLPDHVVREDEMADMLPLISRQAGHKAPDLPATPLADTPFALGDIYDDQLESLIGDVYQRDYMLFGFGPWSGTQAA